MAPLPPAAPLTVRAARDRYLRDNGFSLAEYDAPRFSVKILGVNVRLPNPPSRRAVVPLHDLHHVLTGYRTDWRGEAEIGAWELAAGCNTAMLYFLNGGVALVGMVLAPRRTFRAFRAGRGQRTLYRERDAYEALLELSVAELRERQGIPADGLRAPGIEGA